MHQPANPWTRFAVTVREAGGATILDLSGPLGVGESAKAFRERVDEALRRGIKNLAVNLVKVSYVDSSGLGAFVGAHTAAEAAGGKCIFFGALPSVLRVLKITRLDGVLNLQKDETSTLASFQ
jgi:anti-sigma B factor antagonist